MSHEHSRIFLCASAFAIAGGLSQAALGLTVTLSPSMPSPAPLGTVVTWTADSLDAGPGTTWYRFRVRRAGEEARIVQDYGPSNSFDWTASDYEGVFQVLVDVRKPDTGDTVSSSESFQMDSR